MTDPAEAEIPPDPPPTLQTTAFFLTAASVTLMGVGIIDLILAFLADCLNRLNLFLGLFELAVGLILLFWIVSWWLPRRRKGLRDYEARLDTYRASLERREQALAAASRGSGETKT